MPRIRRQKLPEAVFRHLLVRARERQISAEQLVQLSVWLASNPEVPNTKWFRRFDGFTVCGEAELVKTFLVSGQLAEGQELF
jgi:hypothetical protein